MVAKKQLKKEQDDKLEVLLEDLASLESYIKDLFSFLPSPVCLVSPLGVVLEANPAFERVAGYQTVEVIGEPIEKFFDQKEIDSLYQATVKSGFAQAQEIHIITKDKKVLPVSAAANLRRNEGKEIIGYFLSLFDLSSIKKYENDLQVAKKSLEIRVRELEKFQALTVGRELKMLDLKRENERMRKELGKIKTGV